MMQRSSEKKNILSAFTLIEVMVTMAIMLTLVVAVSSMLRSSIDVKQALARENRITQRLSLAMARMSWDVEHAFVVGLNDEQRGGANRKFKTLFKIEKVGDSDKLYLSTTGNIPLKEDDYESDTAYVVYEVRDAKDSPGRKHLYRGSSALVLDDLKTDPNMKLFVRNIKSFKIIPWRGDAWGDQWDSARGEWRDKLPHMVRIEIQTWNEDDKPGDKSEEKKSDTPTVDVKTVVHIAQARFIREIKQAAGTLRWY